MRRSISIILLCGVTSVACNDTTDPTSITPEPRTPDGFSVSILGPRTLAQPGFYEWNAVVRGGEEDLRYEWTVSGSSGPVEVIGTDQPVLTMSFREYSYSRFEITLVVRSGDQSAAASELVTMCPLERAADWCVPHDGLLRK